MSAPPEPQREAMSDETLDYMYEAAHRNLPIPVSWIDALVAEVRALRVPEPTRPSDYEARIEATERVRAFLEDAESIVSGDVLFGVPDKFHPLLVSDLRLLSAAVPPSPPQEA